MEWKEANVPKARELFQKGVWAAPGNNADVVKVFQVRGSLPWLSSGLLAGGSAVAGVLSSQASGVCRPPGFDRHLPNEWTA